MPETCHLILGNSAAAVAAVAAIRDAGDDRPITLIAREPEHTYSRPLITYLLGGKVDEERMAYRPPDFYRAHRIEAHLDLEAVRVDTRRRRVETGDGRAFAFERLLIATGGRPIVPPDVPGADGEGVFTLTTWDDARRLRAWIAERSVAEAVVVGGGLIGLKSVEALLALGLRVTVVELANRILSATFDRTASDLAQRRLERAGVEVLCNTTVTHVRTASGRVAGVRLRAGREVPCGLVVFAIGVRPALDLVAGSEIATDRGILVDETMRTSVEGVYAAGDVAQAKDLLTGAPRCIAILPNACRQGAVAGSNMAGRPRTYEGAVTMNAVDVCGLATISVGLTDPAAGEQEGYEVLARLDERTGHYRKIVLKDNRIVGAIFIGRIDRAGIVTGLIRQRLDASSFKHVLLTDDFGLISLPADYRKHVVSGQGIEV